MLDILKNLDWSVLTDALINIIPALICITLHELSHGFVAYKLGDPTAKRMGRLSLNPIKHIDIMGLLSMVIFRFGWAKPVPVDMRYFKNPKRGMAISALAGPVTNVLITIVSLLLYGALYPHFFGKAIGDIILEILFSMSYISIALAIFNFVPIPPLDGSKVLFSVISDEAYVKLMRYERYGMIVIIALVYFFNDQFNSVVYFIYDKLFFIAQAAFELSLKLI